jgi:hypothetical protein
MPRRLIISRRKFLKQTILGTVFLAVARVFPRDFLVARSTNGIPADLRYFSPQEYLILEAIAERSIGPTGEGNPSVKDIDVANRADQFLA